MVYAVDIQDKTPSEAIFIILNINDLRRLFSLGGFHSLLTINDLHKLRVPPRGNGGLSKGGGRRVEGMPYSLIIYAYQGTGLLSHRLVVDIRPLQRRYTIYGNS